MTRVCALGTCGKALERREGERSFYFKKRITCGLSCAATLTNTKRWAHVQAKECAIDGCEGKVKVKGRTYCSHTCAALGRENAALHSALLLARAEARFEDVEWLLDQGEPLSAIARRFGVQPKSLSRQATRRNRLDLARRIDALDRIAA